MNSSVWAFWAAQGSKEKKWIWVLLSNFWGWFFQRLISQPFIKAFKVDKQCRIQHIYKKMYYEILMQALFPVSAEPSCPLLCSRGFTAENLQTGDHFFPYMYVSLTWSVYMTDIFHCRYDPKNQMVHGFFFMSSALFRWLFKLLHL